MKNSAPKQTSQLPSSSTTNLLLASVSLSMAEVDKTMSALKRYPEREAEISEVLYQQLLIKRELTCIDELKADVVTRIGEWSQKYGEPSMLQIAFVGKVYGIPVNELLKNQIRPKDLYDLLNCYVVGQEDYKRKLAVAFNLHLLKNKNAETRNMDMPKSSLLVCGPSGSGKTYAIQKLAECFNKPLITINCNSIVPVGIVGVTIPDHFTGAYVQGYSKKEIEGSVVLFDETDKCPYKPEAEALQNELLSLCDDRGEIKFRKSFDHNSEYVCVPTKNMMFVFTGVFDGIDKIRKGYSLGFSQRMEAHGSNRLGSADLLEYGLKPEIVGRIQNYTMLESLTTDDILNVLNAPLESPFLDYQNYFKLQGVNFDVTDEAKRFLAEVAFNRKLGVRGLKGLFNELLSDEMFSCASDHVEVTLEYVKKNIDQIL